MMNKIIKCIKRWMQQIKNMIKHLFNPTTHEGDVDNFDTTITNITKARNEMIESYTSQNWFEIDENNRPTKEIIVEIRKRQLHMTYYNRTKNILTVKISSNSADIMESTIIKVNSFGKLSYVMSESNIGLISTVSLGGKKVDVTCVHIINLMDFTDAVQYDELNPMIYAKPAIKVAPDPYRVHHNAETQIMTMSPLGQQYLITTHVFQTVDTVIRVKKRRKTETIAVIFQIELEEAMIWSGSYAISDTHIFVIGMCCNHPNSNVVSLLAYTVFPHDINLEVST
jgi:hypothetical protein